MNPEEFISHHRDDVCSELLEIINKYKLEKREICFLVSLYMNYLRSAMKEMDKGEGNRSGRQIHRLFHATESDRERCC